MDLNFPINWKNEWTNIKNHFISNFLWKGNFFHITWIIIEVWLWAGMFKKTLIGIWLQNRPFSFLKRWISTNVSVHGTTIALKFMFCVLSIFSLDKLLISRTHTEKFTTFLRDLVIDWHEISLTQSKLPSIFIKSVNFILKLLSNFNDHLSVKKSLVECDFIELKSFWSKHTWTSKNVQWNLVSWKIVWSLPFPIFYIQSTKLIIGVVLVDVSKILIISLICCSPVPVFPSNLFRNLISFIICGIHQKAPAFLLLND